MRNMLLLAVLLVATPVAAAQVVTGGMISEDFEGYALGPRSIGFTFAGTATQWTLSGGSIATGTPSFPARSGSQVYRVQSMASWINPGNPQNDDYVYDLSVYVTGSLPITLTFVNGAQSQFAAISGPNAVQHRFLFQLDPSLRKINGFTLSSNAQFSIDDLVIGNPSPYLPTPEPANWALLIAGFGLVGAMARRRRQLA